MSPAAATQSEASPAPSDEALLAEITPEMQAKLKADSRQQGIFTGFFWTVVGGFMIPNLANQFDAPRSIALPSNHLGIGLLVLLSMIAAILWGGVTMARSFVGQPSMLRAELGYRRQHGKWRWER